MNNIPALFRQAIIWTNMVRWLDYLRINASLGLNELIQVSEMQLNIVYL